MGARVDNSSGRIDNSAPDIFGLINILYLKADRNFDGQITAPELDDVFHGFDQNGDGSVNETEFTGLWVLLTKQPMELAVAFFHLADLTDDAVIDNRDLRPLYHVFDLNGDGSVTPNEFRDKWVDIIMESPFAVLFERADTNRDEFLSQHEFSLYFSSFDSNKDHLVSQTEFENGWHASDFGLSRDADIVFAQLDSDHNGSISPTIEMPALFTKYDTNHDNKLAMLEVTQMKTLEAKPTA
ncbi:hypothetical protein ACJMK2_039338 [Sinanodonta woodiana]|uniref:EF-hand domain-containing protein n=1 Tax=Sinanodonta woodiana TaxID=1069815 RepID=A0ABD3WD73_SINWO